MSSFALVFGLLVAASSGAAQESGAQQDQQPVVPRRMAEAARGGELSFARTELCFGTAKPDGVVTEEEFVPSSTMKARRAFPMV